MSRAAIFDLDLNNALIDEQTIYCKPNKYGYRLNINHPKIRELYNRFKKWKGIAQQFPLSDHQRFEFENYVLKNSTHSEKVLN